MDHAGLSQSHLRYQIVLKYPVTQHGLILMSLHKYYYLVIKATMVVMVDSHSLLSNIFTNKILQMKHVVHIEQRGILTVHNVLQMLNAKTVKASVKYVSFQKTIECTQLRNMEVSQVKKPL